MARTEPSALVLIAIPLATFAARALISRGDNIWAFALDVVAPSLLLAAGLALWLWIGGAWGGRGLIPMPVARVALVCGAAAFVLHSMVEYAIWTPGAATVFWIAAGAVLGRASPGRLGSLDRLRWPVATAFAVAAVAVGWFIWLPVARSTILATEAAAACAAGEAGKAARLARQAAWADGIDSQAAITAARTIAAGCHQADTPEVGAELLEAYHWALKAIALDPAEASAQDQAATIAWFLADPQSRVNGNFDTKGRGAKSGSSEFSREWMRTAVEHMDRAVRLDPQDLRMRIVYAQMLLSAGEAARCLQQIDAGLEIDRRIRAFSIGYESPQTRPLREIILGRGRVSAFNFDEHELHEIDALWTRALAQLKASGQ